MPSPMVSQTLQGAVLSATSNVIAQVMSSYKENTTFALNTAPIIKFMLFSIISNPPNIVWQSFLEDLFPTNVHAALPPSSQASTAKSLEANPTPARTRMSMKNILIKFVLDQTVGAVLNMLMFLVFMGYYGGKGGAGSWKTVQGEISEKFYPMIMDGYKFWPMVSLVSFLWVPVDKRVVFGCSVGVLWGIYLSLKVEA